MSAIDELDALSIDVTNSDSVEDEDEKVGSVSIDASGSDIKTKVNMTSQVKPPVRRHNVIKHDQKKALEGSGAKKIVSQESIPVKPEQETREVHLSPMDDLVGTDNPNSLLNKWIDRKEEEAREWINDKAEEKAVLSEEEGYEQEGTIGEEFESISDNRILVEDDDLVFNSEKNEEEEDMDENLEVNDNIVEDYEDILAGEDDEIPVNDAADIDSNDNNSEEEVIEIEEEKLVIEDEDSEEESEGPDIIVSEEDSAANDEDSEEVLKNLQKMITEKIKPISTKLDLSSFTIVKKPISNISDIVSDTSSRVIKWVLPNQKAIVKMKDFTGAELEKLREYSEDPRSVDQLNRKYKMVYDHIVSPKPQNFVTWLKTTPFSDLEHYFFAVYIANYKGSNFLPVDCSDTTKCKNTWVTDDINIMDMVKFEKDEDKKKFEEIYHSEQTAATGKGVYCTQAVAISDKFAFAFKEASIYNIIEDRLIDARTREKYSEFVDYLPYIDEIYVIDHDSHGLIPITYRRFNDNAVRDIRSKIQKYATVFETLSADEFGPVKAYIRAISERNDGISYNYPELTCPKCGAVVNAEPASAEALVFTRYQLGSLTSTLLS